MSVAPVPPNNDSETEIPNADNTSSPNGIDQSSSASPLLCVARFAGDSAAGALMGSVFGYGSGLLKKKGFKGSFADMASSAKTFAVLSGVHSLVVCFLKRFRGKDDVINAGVAGCCTGLALSFPGAPQALLQSCLTFGAFSCIIEGMNKQQPALAKAASSSSSLTDIATTCPSFVLPPFTLPLPNPNSIMEGLMTSFSQSLPKPCKKKRSPPP